MEKNKTVRIFSDTDGAVDFIIKRWSEIAIEAVKNKGSFSVALSGGKTPAALYDRLCLHTKDIPWEKTQIFLVDERFVPAGSPESNYHLIEEHLLNHVSVPRENVHGVITGGTTHEDAASMYEEQLQRFFSVEDGFAGFDLVMLGIGYDGHTASLFPGWDDLHQKERLIVPVTADIFPFKRITMTSKVINNARHIIFFVTGRHKAKIVQRIIEDRNTVLPAALAEGHTGELIYVLDSAAASFLKRDQARQ